MPNTTQCKYCQKYFFIFNENYQCPHCGKNAVSEEIPQELKDIFEIK